MANQYFSRPNDDNLEDKSGWNKHENSHYSASRIHLVVVHTRKSGRQRGPVIKSFEVPAKAEYSLENKRVTINRNSAEIQESVLESVSETLTEDLSGEMSFALNSGKMLPEINLRTKFAEKISQELLGQVSWTVGSKVSFEIEERIEIKNTVTLNRGMKNGKQRRLSFYPLLTLNHLDFYVYQYDYMYLKYKGSWFWPDVRETIQSETINDIVPLFRVSYYEPDEDLSVAEGNYAPQVEYDKVHEVVIDTALPPCPLKRFPKRTGLLDIARLAFPVTQEEKRRAVKRKVTRQKPTRKAGAKRVPARKAATSKRRTEKRLVARKTTAKKKVTRRSAARKRTTRKTTARKKR